MPDRKILAKIHIAKKELRLSDGEYRRILKLCFGVTTSKKLRDEKATELLSLFKDMGWKQKHLES
jgi:phage gp16-like protein